VAKPGGPLLAGGGGQPFGGSGQPVWGGGHLAGDGGRVWQSPEGGSGQQFQPGE